MSEGVTALARCFELARILACATHVHLTRAVGAISLYNLRVAGYTRSARDRWQNYRHS